MWKFNCDLFWLFNFKDNVYILLWLVYLKINAAMFAFIVSVVVNIVLYPGSCVASCACLARYRVLPWMGGR